ncbi:hypothetical protein IAT38_007284 [Cryptococcus sp. DSM 104549]
MHEAPPSKVNKACAQCRRHKVKCIGGIPCRRCVETSTTCSPQTAQSAPISERMSKVEKEIVALRRALEATQKEIRVLKGGADATGTSSPAPKSPGGALNHLSEDHPPYTAVGNGRSSTSGDDGEEDAGNAEDVEEDQEDEDLINIENIRLNKRKQYGGEGMIGEKRQRTSGPPRRPFQAREREMERVAFQIFEKRCTSMFPFIDSSKAMDFDAMQGESSLFYWAVVAVGAREAVEIADTHRYAVRQAITIARETLFGRRATMDDLRGLLVMWTWLSEARSPGHVVSVAHELGLRDTCSRLSRAKKMHRASSAEVFPEEERLKEALRLYGSLFTLDTSVSTLSGRSRLLPDDRFFHDCYLLLDSKFRRVSDLRTVAQVQAVDTMITPRELEGFSRFQRSLPFIHAVAKVEINCFPLKGVRKATDVTPQRMPYVETTVEVARTLARYVVQNYQPPVILYTSNFTQLQMTHAAVFLLRIIRILPGRYDEEAIVREVKGLADTLAHVSGKYYASRLYALLAEPRPATTPRVNVSNTPTALFPSPNQFDLVSADLFDLAGDMGNMGNGLFNLEDLWGWPQDHGASADYMFSNMANQ